MDAKKGFTLVEMLVVIGIIAVLLGLAVVGLGGMTKKAQRARTQELVSNAATALTLIFNETKMWPRPIVNGAGSQRLDQNVCNAFVRHGDGLLGISYKVETQEGVQRRVVDSQGLERFGLLTPPATDYLKKHSNASVGDKIPGGGTLQDHVLYYAVDLDGDGITELSMGDSGSQRVRATACVWAFCPDGMTGTGKRVSKHEGWVQSWQANQVVE